MKENELLEHCELLEKENVRLLDYVRNLETQLVIARGEGKRQQMLYRASVSRKYDDES